MPCFFMLSYFKRTRLGFLKYYSGNFYHLAYHNLHKFLTLRRFLGHPVYENVYVWYILWSSCLLGLAKWLGGHDPHDPSPWIPCPLLRFCYGVFQESPGAEWDAGAEGTGTKGDEEPVQCRQGYAGAAAQSRDTGAVVESANGTVEVPTINNSY